MPPRAERAAGAEPAPETRRLASLDALRGFDMFWITGGALLFQRLAATTGARPFTWIAAQTEHAEWHGFRLWDLVFPLFLFLAGVSTPLSFEKRRAAGASRGELARHALRRGLALVLLGVVYNGLLRFDFATLRYASVLGRIGLAWMFAALAVLYLSKRGQAMLAAALLLGYWAALSWVPVPGFGAGNLAPGATLTDWVDRALLPGRLHRGVRDPEGLLGTLPAIATALFGVFTGRYVVREPGAARRVAGLAAAGLIALAAGWLWGRVFPLNKNLWTSSFVLWTAGLSLLAFAATHLVVDVLGARRLAFPFVVIGRNAILIYMLAAFVAFDALGDVVFANGLARMHAGLAPLGGLLLSWLLLYALHRRRWYLKV
jgi:predicted acyltransferase